MSEDLLIGYQPNGVPGVYQTEMEYFQRMENVFAYYIRQRSDCQQHVNDLTSIIDTFEVPAEPVLERRLAMSKLWLHKEYLTTAKAHLATAEANAKRLEKEGGANINWTTCRFADDQ